MKMRCVDVTRARHIGQRDTIPEQGPQTHMCPHGRNAWSRRTRRQTQQSEGGASSSSVSELSGAVAGAVGVGAATGDAGAGAAATAGAGAASPSEPAGAAGAGAATGGLGASAGSGGGGGGLRRMNPVMRRCRAAPGTTSRRTPSEPPAKFKVVWLLSCFGFFFGGMSLRRLSAPLSRSTRLAHQCMLRPRAQRR